MSVRRLLVVALAIFLPAAFTVPSSSAATHTYEAEALPGLGFTGHGGSSATDINDRGVAVGYTEAYADACCTGYWHAVVWRNGTIADLGTLSGEHGSQSAATGINERGVVVGWSRAASQSGEDTVAARWVGGVGHRLWTRGEAADVNDVGTVVGTRAGNAVVWRRGSLRKLPGLGGASAAVAVNGRDVVAGWSETAAGERHAVIWRAGRLVDLGPGDARDINDDGLVAGSTPDDGAVIWRGTRIQSLGLPEGVAQAVSDTGLVAGIINGARTQLFVRDRGDVSIVTENIFGAIHAVNDRGVVAGNVGFYDRATLWRP